MSAGEETTTVPTSPLFRAVVENAPDAIYIVSAVTLRVISANSAFQRLLGYTSSELPRLSIHDFVSDRRERICARFQRVLHSELPIRGDRVYRRKNGTTICLDTSAFRLPNSGTDLVCTVARDVTERRQMDGQIRWYRDQLRVLAWQLCLAQHQERRNIAEVLHDQVGQTLTAAILRLDALNQPGEMSERCSSALKEVTGFLHEISRHLRSLTLELSPRVLHEQGLVKALEWLAGRFQAQHDIRVNLDIDADAPKLTEELSVLLFQSLRELLANTAKHARASMVNVRLRSSPPGVEMVVRDDGVGFDPSAYFDPDQERLAGFGLFNIGQRLSHIGGSFEMVSATGKGAQFTLRVPLSQRERVDGH